VKLVAQAAAVARTVQPAHHGAVGDKNAHQKHHRQIEEGGAEGDSGQLFGTGATAHDHIGHRQADNGQLPDQQRQGEVCDASQLLQKGCSAKSHCFSLAWINRHEDIRSPARKWYRVTWQLSGISRLITPEFR